MEKKNIAWINTCKALCMLLVYLNHCCNILGADLKQWDNFYFALYVNSFFIISGYLLFRKQLGEKALLETRPQFLNGGGKLLFGNIVWKIMVPTMIFALINFFPKKLLRGEPIIVKELLFDTLGGCSLWFTCALALAELYFLIMLMTRYRPIWFYAACATCLFLLGTVLQHSGLVVDAFPKQFPWWYKNSLFASIYIAIGGVYWKYEKEIANVFSNKYILAMGFIVYLILLYGLQGKLAYMVAICDVNLGGLLVSSFGCIILIEICKRLPSWAYLQNMGKNTLLYYFFCGASPVVVCSILKKVFVFSPYVQLPVAMLLSLSITGLLVFVITRFMPYLLDFRLIKSSK